MQTRQDLSILIILREKRVWREASVHVRAPLIPWTQARGQKGIPISNSRGSKVGHILHGSGAPKPGQKGTKLDRLVLGAKNVELWEMISRKASTLSWKKGRKNERTWFLTCMINSQTRKLKIIKNSFSSILFTICIDIKIELDLYEFIQDTLIYGDILLTSYSNLLIQKLLKMVSLGLHRTSNLPIKLLIWQLIFQSTTVFSLSHKRRMYPQPEKNYKLISATSVQKFKYERCGFKSKHQRKHS